MHIGIRWCSDRSICFECVDDLWKQLALLDSAIKPTRDHAQLGDVANLLKTFETQLYVPGFLKKEKMDGWMDVAAWTLASH